MKNYYLRIDVSRLMNDVRIFIYSHYIKPCQMFPSRSQRSTISVLLFDSILKKMNADIRTSALCGTFKKTSNMAIML